MDVDLESEYQLDRALVPQLFEDWKGLHNPEDRGQWTYVLQTVGDPWFAKIGRTTGTVKDRMTSIQTGCPFSLSVAYQFKGTHWEKILHQAMSWRATGRGEWFRGEAVDDIRDILMSQIYLEMHTRVAT